MNFKNISIPGVYTESTDFRMFLRWFNESLEKAKYDTENFFDLYDPLRCPENLLWLLSDTMGFKYDERLPTSFNRLVLIYFMSMIYNRGSRDGMILAAETNLAQFVLRDRIYGYTNSDGEQVEGDKILLNRLEDTSIPVNSVYVNSHTAEGYIDVVYFSNELPIDACIEYVRPIGMYLFQRAGVRMDSRTKITIDARLTNSRDIGLSESFGPTQVGHYRRDDYARLQHTRETIKTIDGTQYTVVENDTADTRQNTWYRNSKYEDMTYGDGTYGSGAGQNPDEYTNPGYRALYSLQLCNNEEIVRALLSDEIFSLGYEPQNVEVVGGTENKKWNLRYDRALDESITETNASGEYDVSVVEPESDNILHPIPMINPIMAVIGDALSLNDLNTKYYMVSFDEPVETLDTDYIYTTENSQTNVIFYIGSTRSPQVPEIINDGTVVKLSATSFNESDVTSAFLPEGLTEIE